MLIYVTILDSLKKIALTPSILRKTNKIVAGNKPETSEANKINAIKDRFKLKRIKLKDENVLFLLLLALLISLLLMHLILALNVSSGYIPEYNPASIVVTLTGMLHC